MLKKPVRLIVCALVLALCLAVPAFAACGCPDPAPCGCSEPEPAPAPCPCDPAPCACPKPEPAKTCCPGTYKPTPCEAQRICATAFLAPNVWIDPCTLAIHNVCDNGNLINATLSSDGHFYIVPTTCGYRYIGTGY